MARRSLTTAAVLIAALALTPVPASAGFGGCHEDTQGSGDTVEMVEYCFTPTTLRIDPGGTVTSVNRSAQTHNVVAPRWGRVDDLAKGDAFTATFDEPGVYPYTCTYHGGMSGAIVVGDGVGPGDEEVRVAPFEPTPMVEVRTVRTEAAASPVGWFVGGGIGLALGLGIAGGARALGRRRTTASS